MEVEQERWEEGDYRRGGGRRAGKRRRKEGKMRRRNSIDVEEENKRGGTREKEIRKVKEGTGGVIGERKRTAG